MRKVFFSLLLAPSLAFSQVSNVDTLFTAVATMKPSSIVMQLVNNGTAIPGQSVTIIPSGLGWAFLTASFSGQSTQMTVTGVRVTFTLPPGNGWSQDSPWPLTANMPVTVPAGNTLTVAYNPVVGTLTPTFTAPAAIPAPVVATTAVPPSGTLTTSQGTWSFGIATGQGGNALLLNGANTGGGFGTKLYLTSGNVFTSTLQNTCYQWNGANWGAVALSNCP